MHGTEHGVDVRAATIRWQRGQVEAGEVASTKLVEEVGNFLVEVAQLAELAEAHLISVHHLLPLQRPPTNIVLSSPRRWCVISRRRFVRAKILQRMPRQRP